MFRISFIIVALFLSLLVNAQESVNVTDSRGKRQGLWRKSDSAGMTVYEGRFKDGIPVGEFRYYYPNGKLKTISGMSLNGRKAATVSYFPNGKKMAAGNYLDEKKDSTWEFFSESMGTLVSRESYKAGIIEGLSKIYYPEGGISEQFYFKNGIRDGIWEQFFTDGKIKLRGAYKSGEKQGAFKLFFPDGKVMLSGQYYQGHQDGDWIYYDEKGGIRKTETYRRGELIMVTPPE